jgi:ABC-type transport system involved in cytochrome bd biosynthesis fused ATPase/permease subunit
VSKRLVRHVVPAVSAVGLVLLIVVVTAVLDDRTGLALLAVAGLQALVLGVAVQIWRGQRSMPAHDQGRAVAELNRAIANVGLRAVDEARATERELGARIDALRELLTPKDVD